MNSHKTFAIIFFLFLSVLNILAYHNAFHTDLRYDQETVYSGAKIPHLCDRVKYAFFIHNDNQLLNEQKLLWFRPAAFLLSWQLFRFFDGHVYWINLFNIGFLTMTGFVLFLLIFYLSRDRLLAGLAGMLFCLHPVNGVWVNYAPGGVHGLLALSSMLACLLFFCMSLNEGHSKTTYVLSLFAFIVALLFHEMAVFLPIYLAVSIYFLHTKDPLKAYRRLIPLGLIEIVYIVIRFGFLAGSTELGDRSNGLGINFLSYILTLSKVFVLYISKLITLKGIVINWNEPFVQSFSWLWASVSVLLLGVLFYAMTRKNRTMACWAIVLMLIGFIPVCGGGLYYPKQGLVYGGHWLYFTAIGFIVLLAFIITVVLRKWRVVGLGLLASVTSFLMIMGWNYNALYADEIGYTLYYQQYAPGFRVARLFLYNAYIKQGKYAQARATLMDGLTGTNDDYAVYQTLAYLDFHLGNYDQVERSLTMMQNIGAMEAKDLFLLGIIYEKKSDYQKAIMTYAQVLKIEPCSLDARLGIERLASQLTQVQERQ